MINLLPPLKKQEIKQEENWKILMTLGISISAILICFILILYAINVFIAGDVGLEKILYGQREKEFESSEMQALKTEIVEFNNVVFQLNNFYQNQLKPTETIEKILKTIPGGIYLTNLSVNPGSDKDKRIQCELKGLSPTREILLSFKENLEKEESFEEVSFPPATWLKSIDINFTVTFKINDNS
jgi:Tfp pilus assembly protein PilN